MPTYEYRCKSCGEHLEVVQSFKDGPLAECPACGGTLRKVFGNIGIAFKGSGFYKNDSRTAAKSGASSSSDASSKSSADSGKSSSDSGKSSPDSGKSSPDSGKSSSDSGKSSSDSGKSSSGSGSGSGKAAAAS